MKTSEEYANRAQYCLCQIENAGMGTANQQVWMLEANANATLAQAAATRELVEKLDSVIGKNSPFFHLRTREVVP